MPASSKKSLHAEPLEGVNLTLSYKPDAEDAHVSNGGKILLRQRLIVTDFTTRIPEVDKLAPDHVRLSVYYYSPASKSATATVRMSGTKIQVNLTLSLEMHRHVQQHNAIRLYFSKFETFPEPTRWDMLKDYFLRRDSLSRTIPVKDSVTLARLRSEPIILTYSGAEIFSNDRRLPMFMGGSDTAYDNRPASIIPFGKPRNPFHSK